jgi:hypothetical protein
MNNDNINNDSELMGNLEHLNKMKKDNPFRQDADYFDALADKISARIENLSEIEGSAPLLASIPKFNPFAVPAGYFDELPTRVQQSLPVKKASAIIELLRLMISLRFAVPVLSTVLVAFLIIRYTGNSVVEVAEDTNIQLEEQLQHIDEATIIDALTAELNTAPVENEDQGIVDYLLDNDLDETNLNNEL